MRPKLALIVFFVSLVANSAAPPDWSGLVRSSASKFRAGTSITHPIAFSLPRWTRSNAADLDFISRNPAFLTQILDEKELFVPISVQAFGSGEVMSYLDAVKNPEADPSKLAANVIEDSAKVQRAQVALHSYYLMQNFAYSFHYLQSRNLWFTGDSDETFNYQLFRDLVFQFSSGGIIESDPSWGRVDMGLAIKGLIRLGAEKSFEMSDISNEENLSDSDFFEQGMGLGLDFSLLWSSPGVESSGWGLQLAYVAKDIATTQFYKSDPFFKLFGLDIPQTKKFPYIPNNNIVGAGLKLPNFSDGVRSALRVEYDQWTRPVSAVNKVAIGYELRLPALASFYLGWAKSGLSGGATFRFPGFDLSAGTYSELWSNSSEVESSRYFMLELRSVL